jgi:L-threonylcarbamoyladenylate synthase
VIIRETELAVDALSKGNIVALPTDTFYSLSVVYDDLQGLERLVELKETSNPLLLLIPSMAHLDLVTKDTHPLWLEWLDTVWPSAITFLFPAGDNLLPIITLGTNKVGVRIPGSTDLLNLLSMLDKPVTGTSANPQGLPPASTSRQVEAYFPELEYILEFEGSIDAATDYDIEPSTLVDLTIYPPHIVRHGKVVWEMLPDIPSIPLITNK